MLFPYYGWFDQSLQFNVKPPLRLHRQNVEASNPNANAGRPPHDRESFGRALAPKTVARRPLRPLFVKQDLISDIFIFVNRYRSVLKRLMEKHWKLYTYLGKKIFVTVVFQMIFSLLINLRIVNVLWTQRHLIAFLLGFFFRNVWWSCIRAAK